MNRREFLKLNLVGIASVAIPSIAIADTVEKTRFGDTFFSRKSKTSIEELNDRLLIVNIKKAMADGLLFDIVFYDFNDSYTRSSVTNMMSEYFDALVDRGALLDYTVICDETNNSPKVIDSNRFVMDVRIKSGYTRRTYDLRSEVAPELLDAVVMV